MVSNLKDGVDTYSIPPRHPLRSFRHPIRCNVPLLVTTALQGDIIVAGGDDGDAKIFEQRSGQLLQNLRHGNGMAFRCTFAPMNSDRQETSGNFGSGGRSS